MKICMTWPIILSGFLCVFPVDIIGQTCRCRYNTICKSCDVGCNLWYYRCYECPETCYSCSSINDCDECNTGYYGKICDHCADGYYYNYDSGGYCRQCKNNCVTCSSYHVCTSCIAGHTGSYCRDCTDGYYRNNGQCISCNANCLQSICDDNTGKCTDGCYNGWSGFTCNNACASDCFSCDRYNAATCNHCLIGHYGSSCDACSSTCVAINGVRQCSERNGDCNYGCVDGWTGSKCTEKCNRNCISCDAQDKAKCHTCRPGFYGQSCANECSSNCVNAKDVRHCSKGDGHCTDGCVEGWTGSLCKDQCYEKCTSCYRQNEMACTSCKPGYYGPSCNTECSKYCGKMSDATRQCQQNSGTCLGDCVTGYKGDQCDLPCDAGCRSDCDQNAGTCQPCKLAYFGPSCQHPCNATCYDPSNDSNVCDQLSGKCLFDCPKHLCSLDGSTKDTLSSVKVAVIGGAVGSVLMITSVVAAVLVFMFYRQRRNMSDPEMRVSYDNHVQIEDENTGDNVYSDTQRRVKYIVDNILSTAHSTLLKLPSNGPVTTGDVVYSNVRGVPLISSRLGVDESEDNVVELWQDVASESLKVIPSGVDEPEYSVEELFEDETISGDLKDHYTASNPSLGPVYEKFDTNDDVDVGDNQAHHTNFTRSKRQVTKEEANYTALTPAPVGPVYEELDTNVDVECGDIQAHYTALTPSQGPVYEELNKNHDNDYGDTNGLNSRGSINGISNHIV